MFISTALDGRCPDILTRLPAVTGRRDRLFSFAVDGRLKDWWFFDPLALLPLFDRADCLAYAVLGRSLVRLLLLLNTIFLSELPASESNELVGG